ncbi:hypothetical protein F4778DRAFT_786083 [Xylariomycetidae sp. FL2044]|nr:hypothetical protein F4778DRAFT_786083 [Xylariomycetidae sp. FL2044]
MARNSDIKNNMKGKQYPRRSADDAVFEVPVRKHMTNSPIFRWTAEHSDKFCEHIQENGPASFTNIDNLMVKLNLHGYDKIRTERGQSVKAIFEEKVRRKLRQVARAFPPETTGMAHRSNADGAMPSRSTRGNKRTAETPVKEEGSDDAIDASDSPPSGDVNMASVRTKLRKAREAANIFRLAVTQLTSARAEDMADTMAIIVSTYNDMQSDFDAGRVKQRDTELSKEEEGEEEGEEEDC